MKKEEIEKIVKARVIDAEVLFNAERYDGSVYLCGYAIELGLKARICNTLNWSEYRTSRDYQTFRTHNLDVLLNLSGIEDKIKLNHFTDWSIVTQWSPEARYSPIGNVQKSVALDMLESTKELLKVL